jgi:hypothetical protein
MNVLSLKIKKFFPQHTFPCLRNFILVTESILQSRTVCLYKCRDKVAGLSKGKIKEINTGYTRMIRFFKMKEVMAFVSGIRVLILNITPIDMSYLIIDRTNWKRGTKNINLFTIGGLMDEVFVPFYWLQLNKGGGSNIEERKSLIEGMFCLAQTVGRSLSGSILLADREFIGQTWFQYLLSKKLSFVIRLREKMYFELQTCSGKKNFIKDLS